MHSAIGRRDALAVSILGLIGAGIPLGLTAAAGAIGLPAMDDWVYMRGADSLFRTGTVEIPGSAAAAIGQIVMVQPLLWLDLTWYDDALLPMPPCAVLSSSRLDDGALRLIRINTAAYRQYLFFGREEPLYLYGASSAGCPALRAA